MTVVRSEELKINKSEIKITLKFQTVLPLGHNSEAPKNGKILSVNVQNDIVRTCCEDECDFYSEPFLRDHATVISFAHGCKTIHRNFDKCRAYCLVCLY